jgi:Ca2+-transporting ATPase
MIWHRSQAGDVLRELDSSLESGLSGAEAGRRIERYGSNELSGSGIRSPWAILFDQFKQLMVVILIVAAVISALLSDFKDAAAIGAIVVLNAMLGFSQEYRAEKAMAALRKLSVPLARVRRDGEVREITSAGLVPGDILYLEAGNFVAADGRVLESAGLQAHEAALTGESEPIRKVTDAIDEDGLALGDRRNMVYRGTLVTAGRGTVTVTETGMRSELGRIATMIQTVAQEATPLQKRLEHLGRRLAAAALSIVAVIFVIGLLRGEDLKLMLLTAVSIGVAAVPEGLPAVVTIALTLGAQRMLKRRVLVRRLAAVETLGSVTVICSDKTGTLTENRMSVEQLYAGGQTVQAAGGPVASGATAVLLAGGALCNDAVAGDSPIGDPTEVALVVAASRHGIDKAALEAALPRVGEVGFDSARKRMTTIHRVDSIPPVLDRVLEGREGRIAFTKGSVDGLLGISDRVWADGAARPLDPDWRRRIEEVNERLASQGMRVLGSAFRYVEDGTPLDSALEQGLTFVGVTGIIDPPRKEAAAAVATCQNAGVRAVMITGDHPLTAVSIAAQLGIRSDSPAVTGAQLDRMQAEEIRAASASAAVYARVAPEHKLRIVEGLQSLGQIVAMTGDGVNDAPALKRADIGVAMGITGSDAAKESADMVLLDDNFATIVAAVEEGRVIYDNVRKFIKYILATNSGEIWLMLVAPLAGMPIPLLPLQLLWMNLVTDGLPALALGIEPAEPGIMRRPPHPPNESIFARGLGRHVLWVGMLMAALSLGVGYYYWSHGDPAWQTILFTTLTFTQMAHVMAIRSEQAYLVEIGLLTNKPLLAAVMSTFLLQLALVYVPLLQGLFKTVALEPRQLILTMLLSAVVFHAVEIEKWLNRRSARLSGFSPS